MLYSHRSTVIHAYAIALPDVLDLRATSRILPVVPMFHVNAWGIPYATALTGAALVLPGRHLDGASLARMLNQERVTMTCGVPTVWLGLLQHLRASGEKLATVKRIMTGGSAAPPLLIEAFRDEFGVAVEHGWGMTELSPVGTYNAPKPAQAGLSGEPAVRHMLKQGRVLPGIDMKIVDGDGRELPWDGKQFGDLMVRGPWVCSGYYGDAPGSACDADGWFATGDVATIDPDGYMEITDRSKDVIKSGGEWISSITLENIAVSHPDVAEAAVVAARHPKWDERPLLLVVPRPGHTVDPASVLQHLSGPGGEVVAARRRRRGGRAAAHRDRQAAEDGAAQPLSRLLPANAERTPQHPWAHRILLRPRRLRPAAVRHNFAVEHRRTAGA